VIVIAVPPAVVPDEGLTEVIVGELITTGSVYVKAGEVTVPESVLVTETSFKPATPAGVTQVIEVSETTTTEVQAEPPTVTVAPAAKFAPVIVIAVPPVVRPVFGETEIRVGTGVATVIVKVAVDVPTAFVAVIV
jgi:hypothetical protein